jgi:hypothetical protein
MGKVKTLPVHRGMDEDQIANVLDAVKKTRSTVGIIVGIYGPQNPFADIQIDDFINFCELMNEHLESIEDELQAALRGDEAKEDE